MSVESLGAELNDPKVSLKQRFHALFQLRSIGGTEAVDQIARCFSDKSALLKHELAYCLGQIGDAHAISYLYRTLEDQNEHPIVRHEAGEALGAIGSLKSLPILEQYSTDDSSAVAETCQLAVQRINWCHSPASEAEELSKNPYESVDPSPPLSAADEGTDESLSAVLLDPKASLWDRYRAMFSLRNRGTPEAIRCLAQGLKCPSSALFRHEIAYVLGQIQSDIASKELINALADTKENPMVRHECAEALGSIGTEETSAVLHQFLRDPEPLVHESCLVALDITENIQNFIPVASSSTTGAD